MRGKWTIAAPALVLGALVFMVVLMGNTTPTCVPAAPGTEVCFTADDCTGEPEINCLGHWTCVDAACEWECDGGSGECASDDDCPAGSACLCMTACPGCRPGMDCPPCITECHCEPMLMDSDGDGWSDDQDCAPYDPTISPSANELCNGIDDDCDGLVDEGCCVGAQPEVCNGVDDDCDGLVDEGCWPCNGDADCPPYFHCEHTAPCDCSEPTPDGQTCACPTEGVCVPEDPYPAPCDQTASGELACPAGFTCECLSPPDCPMCEMCYMGCVPAEEPACGGYQSGACPEGQDCVCGADPSCPMCAVCWFSCQPSEPGPEPCGPEGQICGEGFVCECRPPCAACSSCVDGCYPSDGRCRSKDDCWPFETCDLSAQPQWCDMIMAPVLPEACWGVCDPCDDVYCPMIACPAGTYMDPCTCACVGY